jgi:hypothetical protein
MAQIPFSTCAYELGFFGIDLRRLVLSNQRDFVFSEVGLGGGGSDGRCACVRASCLACAGQCQRRLCVRPLTHALPACLAWRARIAPHRSTASDLQSLAEHVDRGIWAVYNTAQVR